MRRITYYKISKLVAASALGLSDVQDWAWDGVNIVVRHTDVETPNTPINNITQVEEKYTVVPWASIRTQFFSSIPDRKFIRMTISFTTDDIIINLNLEEN